MRRLSWLRSLALVAPLFFGLVAAADTSDVPDQATNVPTLRADEAGSKTVNPQTGAAAYSYSFKLPPARGVGPALGLHYASNGPLRGTVAHGWTLGIPEIRRNVLLEVAGTVTDPNPATTTGKAYEANLGGRVQQLVQVSDPATSSGAKAFRARFDASFVRYEKTPAAWRAYTSDGTTFYFETSVGEWWVLTRVVDRHGNTVTYSWRTVEWQVDSSGLGTKPSDLVLAAIEYSSNTTAVPNLASHARVDLIWTPSSDTYDATGLRLPVGAAVDYSTGNRRVLGTQRLDAIYASVRQTPGSAWSRVHQWTFDYAPLQWSAAPRRQLWHIREAGLPHRTDGPTITFTYGDVPDSKKVSPSTLRLPNTTMSASSPYSPSWQYPQPVDHNLMQLSASAQGRFIPSIASLMMDIDGDGLPDLVRSNGSPGGCEATYYHNLGNGSFGPGRSFTLPAPAGMPDFRQWPVCQQNNGQPTTNCVARVGTTGFAHPEAECSLAGAWWANFSGSSPGSTFFEGYVYKWIDVDGDNRVDLVAQYYTTDCQGKLVYPNYNRTTCTPPNPASLTWRWYRNITDENGTRFEYVTDWTVGVAMAGFPKAGYFSEQPKYLLFAYVDINGDHWPDIVTQDFTRPLTSAKYDEKTRQWCVPADAKPRFNIKYGTANGPKSSWAYMPLRNYQGPGCLLDTDFPVVPGQLVDTNGDGLSDFLQEIIDSPGGVRRATLQAYVNTGHGTFDTDAVGLVTPVFLLTYDAPSSYPPYTTFSSQQSPPNFPRDLDGDGLLDFPCFITGPTASCLAAMGEGIAFGNGGGFYHASSLADRSLYPHPSIQGERIGFTSRVYAPFEISGKLARDFLDLDGDGAPERYEWVEEQRLLGHYDRSVWNRPAGVAPGLLTKIDNGRGGTITFQYSRSTQADVSATPAGAQPPFVNAADPWVTHDWIRPSPVWPMWVVNAVTVDDGQGHSSRTGFYYADPVWIPDNPVLDNDRVARDAAGRRFRGFQAVSTTLPIIPGEAAPPQLFTRYTYAKDPEGLADYRMRLEWSPSANGYRKVTIDRTTYVAKSVLGGTFWVPHSSSHIECAPSSSDCDSQTTGHVDRTYTFSAITVGGQTVRWNLTSTSETTLSSLGTTITRSQDTHFLNSYGAGDYLVLPKRTVEKRLSQEIGRQEMFYDNATSVDACGVSVGTACGKGALTKKRVYWVLGSSQTAATCPTVADPDNTRVQIPQCVDYGFAYDDYGNVTRTVAPLAMVAAGGQPSAVAASKNIAYDSTYRLFPVTLTSACARCAVPTQQVTQVFDLGTGLPLATFGPNRRQGGTSWVYEQRAFAYDGLGRLLRESDSQTDEAAGYIPRTTHSVSYDPFPANRVTETFYNDWEGTRCTAARKYFDGLGRLYAEQRWPTELTACPATATSPAWPSSLEQPSGVELRRYDYDLRSNVASVRSPNPQNDAFGLVTYAFRYDARDRLIASTAPDGATSTVNYPPFEKVATEPDGTINHQYADGFGTLWRVDEFRPGDAAAQTLYGYDRYGLLSTVKVQDTDNAWHTTTLINDPAGHRTRITRPGAPGSWNYQYDANGRVVSKTDPDGRTTRYQYDDLDRITYEIADDPKLPADQALALGVGQIHYMYDGATPQDQSGEPLANRLGRLSGVELSAAGQSAPYASVRYGYDAQGHEAFTAWQLQVGPAQYTPGINASFQAVRSFDSQGRITSATYSTSIPQLAPTTVSWLYGGRGLLDEVRGNKLQLAKYGYTLAGPPRLRYAANSEQPFQFHSYVYDVRGRLTADLFSFNANFLHRTYAYSNAGDVTSVGIDDFLPDRPRLQAQMNVTTDGLHRIVSASSASSALPYAANLSYWPSGSIKTAGVQLPSSASQPSRPAGTTYTYGTGVAADVQAVTALTAGTATLARFTYDASGNMTRRDLGGLSSGSVTDFLYDPNDQARRAANGNGTEQYYYDHTRRRFLTVSNTAQSPFYRFHLGDEFELEVSTFGTRQFRARFRVNVSGNGETIARLYQCWGCLLNVQPTILLHHDRRGDLLAAIGINGSLWAHNIYGAFGEHLYKAASEALEPFRNRFNGKEQDDIAGLSYYGHRCYDPVTFQWTTGDPLYQFAPGLAGAGTQRQNIYAFTLNNPLSHRDLNGLSVGDPHLDSFSPLAFQPPYAGTLLRTMTTLGRELFPDAAGPVIGEIAWIAFSGNLPYFGASSMLAAAQKFNALWADPDIRPGLFAKLEARAGHIPESLRPVLAALFAGRKVDLNDIRIHVQSISSNSFTLGNHVFLSADVGSDYRNATHEIGQTLGHEITHTVQQAMMGFWPFMERYFGGCAIGAATGCSGYPGEYGRPENYGPPSGGPYSAAWKTLVGPPGIPRNQLDLLDLRFTLDQIADYMSQGIP